MAPTKPSKPNPPQTVVGSLKILHRVLCTSEPEPTKKQVFGLIRNSYVGSMSGPDLGTADKYRPPDRGVDFDLRCGYIPKAETHP